MLFNNDLEKVQTITDCLTCPYFDKVLKKCNGIGKCCFEYDPIIMTALDPITKLPIKLDKLKELRNKK